MLEAVCNTKKTNTDSAKLLESVKGAVGIR
jgi:hypothetical protein